VPILNALSQSVGWPHQAEDWAQFLSLGEGLAACAPDGSILGTAMLWRWSPRCATIGMVLVAPRQQGQGIGRRLMQALLDMVPHSAVRLHATPAGLGLYESLGFRSIGHVCQHQGVIDRLAVTADLRRARSGDLGELLALDRAGFGTLRGDLIERVLTEGEIRVLERDGMLCGFAARREFGRGETIGPVVAENEKEAIALIAACLRPGFQRIDIPAHATKLAAWLTRAGLAEVDTVTVMTRGVWPPGLGGVQRFALAGQALG
jgi:GNAT superfamily N-acetyltransferase